MTLYASSLSTSAEWGLFSGKYAVATISLAPAAPAMAPARSTARYDESDPSVPTTTVLYALMKGPPVPFDQAR
ncbi:Uncharacterised protein [Mycobacteroides abscessus subsp. abscessus]|nr:Uncharacterised protein [Mycobacteroides abscessus subsp. abscessus]